MEPEVVEALRVCLRKLRTADRFEGELRATLAEKGISEGAAREAISFLSERRFLSDQRTLRALQERMRSDGWGREAFRVKLLARGWDEESADLAAETWGEEGEQERAGRIAEALKSKGVGAERAYGRIVRRGFESSVAEEAVRSAYGGLEEWKP
jgi:SOS response regulatory protein OraA/RecX